LEQAGPLRIDEFQASSGMDSINLFIDPPSSISLRSLLKKKILQDQMPSKHFIDLNPQLLPGRVQQSEDYQVKSKARGHWQKPSHSMILKMLRGRFIHSSH
jgi:hypothetical protein